MAHLVRPIKVFYVDRQGKRVPKSTPGAKKVKEKARKWYAQGVPGYPPKKRIPLASDKTVAQTMLADLIKKGERGQAGLEDKETEAQRVPLRQHLDDFERHVRASGATPKHVAIKFSRLRRMVAACGFERLADIDPDRVQQYLADLQNAAPEVPPLERNKDWFSRAEVGTALGIKARSVTPLIARHGLAAQGSTKARRYPRQTVEELRERLGKAPGVATANYYLRDLKGFCRWLVDGGKLSRNPLAKLKPGNAALDRRHDRRNLTVEELGRLLNAARDSDAVCFCMSGEDRYHLYLTACSTGFRAGELASLMPSSFRLDADPPHAVLAARKGKNRKPTVQPLPGEVVAAMRQYLKGKPAGGLIWPGATWRHRTSDSFEPIWKPPASRSSSRGPTARSTPTSTV
jgi:integrase